MQRSKPTMAALLLAIIVLVFVVGCTATADTNQLQAGEQPSTGGQLSDSSTLQPSCPKGFVEDPYPGACGSYVDRDSDNICDLSQ